MEKRPFGKTDMHCSALGFGGAEVGFHKATAEAVSRLLNSALDAGLNVIDTQPRPLASECRAPGRRPAAARRVRADP